jgi:3-phenylpropionate/trans-cinnamate dioxygenase ferredoxin reductase component
VNAKYVIIGSGMTADAAVRGIREVDRDGTITMIGGEADPPYKRPPLSKGLWHGKPIERIWCNTQDLDVDLRLGRTITWIDRRNRCVVDDRGVSYTYESLLFATGSSPRQLPFDDDRIIYFRTLNDYRRLRQLTDDAQRIAVIGGGFIGSEIAAALAAHGKTVSLIFPGEAIGDAIFPADLACSLNDLYRDHGVEVLTRTMVTGLRPSGQGAALTLKDAVSGGTRELLVDGVVAGIGTEPNVDLARQAGLAVDNGIVVDRFLRTIDPHIVAAGDVANYVDPLLHTRRRVEHEDNARVMGRHAGRTMAGAPEPYNHIPFFYSDLFDLGYEAVGELDPTLETVAEWTTPFKEGVVQYRRNGRVRGVLLWNVWGQVDAASELIRRPEPEPLLASPLPQMAPASQ